VSTPSIRPPLYFRALQPWWARLLIAIVLLILVVPEACVLQWRWEHPAPWGRTATAVERTARRLMPPGTTLDSARAILSQAGVEYTMASFPDSMRAVERSQLTAGVTLRGILRNIDADMVVAKSARLTLTFDGDHRLTRVQVDELYAGS
jgi:hypothetical protein